MFLCAGKFLNSNVRLCMFNKTYTQKYFSVLYPVNHRLSKNNINEISFLEPKSTNVQHFRNFSLNEIHSFSTGFYEFVTSSTVSKLLNDYIIQTHDITGLPWWSTIVLLAGALKLFISFPLAVYQQHLIAKLKNTKTELVPIVEKLKQEILVQGRKEKWTKKKATLVLSREIKKHMNILVVKNNCHPFKSVIINLSQLPFWILMSLTLRKFATDVSYGTSESILAALQFQVGGPFWCSNLTLPDPTYIIPTLLVVVSLISIELNTLSPTHILNFTSKVVTFVLRSLALLSFVVSTVVPSGVSLFWLSSVIIGLIQNLLFMSPRFRKFLRIPKTALDLDQPYLYAINKFKEKWFRKLK